MLLKPFYRYVNSVRTFSLSLSLAEQFLSFPWHVTIGLSFPLSLSVSMSTVTI